MKVNSYTSGDSVVFDNFIVVKKKDTYFGVYEYCCGSVYGEEITHGETLHAACKKAKLLQIGYNIHKQNSW
jgi:hypothetical protein